MADFKFGDLLRYPDDQGVGDEILFMFVGVNRRYDCLEVMVIRDPEGPWQPGEITSAGVEELIPYVPPGTKVYVDGKELDVASVEWGGMDFGSGSDSTVLAIRDVSGSISGNITISAEALLAALDA